jgi:hypothetical protein
MIEAGQIEDIFRGREDCRIELAVCELLAHPSEPCIDLAGAEGIVMHGWLNR